MRFFKYGSIILVLFAVLYSLSFYLRMSGTLDEIHAPTLGTFQQIDIAQGTEDLVIDRSTGLVYVGADNTLKRLTSPMGADGIYVFPIDNPTDVRLASANGPVDLHPHGISLWSGAIQKRLFVVNHKSTGEHTVEIFDIGEAGVLTHRKTVMFDQMYSPNDVHAVGPDAFYATNDRGFNDSAMNKTLSLLGLPFATAVYYDGEVGRKVVGGLAYANGINGSPDGKTLYIAESVPKTVTAYTRDSATGELVKARSFSLNSSPDNIDVDDHGMLWVAGHENLFKYIKFIKEGEPAPSHVLKLDPASGQTTDIFYDEGRAISGATTGVFYNDKLIVGAVHENFVIIVDL